MICSRATTVDRAPTPLACKSPTRACSPNAARPTGPAWSASDARASASARTGLTKQALRRRRCALKYEAWAAADPRRTICSSATPAIAASMAPASIRRSPNLRKVRDTSRLAAHSTREMGLPAMHRRVVRPASAPETGERNISRGRQRTAESGRERRRSDAQRRRACARRSEAQFAAAEPSARSVAFDLD